VPRAQPRIDSRQLFPDDYANEHFLELPESMPEQVYGRGRIPGCERRHRKIPKPAEERMLIATQVKQIEKLLKVEI
jgi:hypothetical protein